MLRLILPLFIVLFSALPVLAEEPLSPGEIESLPFATHGVATPNTHVIMDDIDMRAEVEGEGHGKAGLPQFNTSTFASQLFWLAISFTVLYFFFSKSSLPRLSATIEERMATIKSDIEHADKLSAEAATTKESYEQAMSGAHDKARIFITQTVDALRQDAEKDAAAFKVKSDEEIRNLEAQADAAKNKIKNELAETAYSLTQEIIAKLTPLSVQDGDIRKTVDSYMENNTTNTRKKAA